MLLGLDFKLFWVTKMETIECKGKFIDGNKIFILDDAIKSLALKENEEVKIIIIKKSINDENILIEEDSLFNIKSSGNSDLGNLSEEHDKYLYGS